MKNIEQNEAIKIVSSNPIKQIMPAFFDVVSSAVYKPANYRDWALRAIPEYGWTSQELYQANMIPVVLPDVAVISDYCGKGEQIIINTLEKGPVHTDWIRLELLMMNNDTKLNVFHSLPLINFPKTADMFQQENAELYNNIKKECADTVTVLSPQEVHELHYMSSGAKKTRERILEGLFLGNKHEENDFIDSICDNAKLKRDLIFNNCFSYKAEGFIGVRFLKTTTIENTKYDVLINMLELSTPRMDDCGNLLAVDTRRVVEKVSEYR